MKKDKNIIYIVLGMIVFAAVFGLFCRFTVLAASDPDQEEEEQHYTDEELNEILNRSQEWLNNNPVPEVATKSDADYDVKPYLTYPLDQEWIDSNTSVNSALNDIYRMVLSIRNVLLLIACLLVAFWFDKKLHAIINKLFGGR